MDWDVRRFAELDSTNRWVLERARAGGAEGLVAVADHQTAGRGRLGRTWDAPPGTALLCSVLLRPSLPAGRLHLVPAAVALAAARACEDVGGARPGLKWPNDLVVGDAKLGGILAESQGGAVVVGLGLNLSWAPPGATALGVAGTDAGAVLTAVLAALSAAADGDWSSVAADYRRACCTIGRTVRVDLAGESFTGVAADVDDDGHLLVGVGTSLRPVAVADVVHLRAV